MGEADYGEVNKVSSTVPSVDTIRLSDKETPKIEGSRRLLPHVPLSRD